MEAWSEDFNPVEKSVIQSFPHNRGDPNPDVQERHCTTNNIWEVWQDAFLPLQLMQDHSAASYLKPSMKRSSSSNSLWLAKKHRSSIAFKDSTTTKLSCSKQLWPISHNQLLHAPCTKMPGIPLGFGNHDLKGILQSRNERLPSQDEHWVSIWGQGPSDLFSHHARWYQFSLMPSRMRSSDWACWDGLAENREMGSGWWERVWQWKEKLRWPEVLRNLGRT